MFAMEDFFEERKIHHNGATPYVNVPRSFYETLAEAMNMPAELLLIKTRVNFRIKDGKAYIELELPKGP